jgi:hypothetical protein
MPKTKRGGDDLARSLHKNRKTCNGGRTDSLASGLLVRTLFLISFHIFTALVVHSQLP